MMAKNVLIPLVLIEEIIELLEYWDVSKHDVSVQIERNEVLQYLYLKKRRLDLRDDYARMIHTKNEDDRHDARIRYLQERTWLREDEADIPF